MKKKMKKALLFVIALTMLLTMLPGAAMGEVQSAAAKSVVEKKKDIDTAYLLLRESENLPQLPQGTKPVEKIIPRRCMIVRHNYEFTIPVVIAPVTLTALQDLAISWNSAKLNFVNATYKMNSNRLTMYLTFRAIGKPTDTTQVNYQSLAQKAVKSRTYVTIVPTKVKSVQLFPPTASLPVGVSVPFIATVLPDEATNKAVRWYSTNPGVATVADGMVTTHAVGTATIYVITVSGHKKATSQLTVGLNPPPPPVA